MQYRCDGRQRYIGNHAIEATERSSKGYCDHSKYQLAACQRILLRSEATPLDCDLLHGYLSTRPRIKTPEISPTFPDDRSNAEAFETRRMEQFLRLQQAARQSFRVVLREESIERMFVRGETVRPEIVAHQCARGAQLSLDKRQCHLRSRCIGQTVQCDRFRFLEGLHHRHRQPRMLFNERAPDAKRVHD